MKRNISQTNSQEQTINFTKVVATTIVQTVSILVAVLGYVVIALSVIAPKVITPIFKTLKMDRANYLVYKRMYERDPNKENLYNVIQLSIENENYKDQVVYISNLLEDEEFSDFCKSVDGATREALGERFSIYADSYEGYLRHHLVVALYNIDRVPEAKMMAIDSVRHNFYELYAYIQMVINDENLTDIQRESEMTSLCKYYALVSEINTKSTELDVSISLVTNVYEEIVLLQQKLKLTEIEFYLGKYGNDEELEQKSKENWENIETIINEKLEQLE